MKHITLIAFATLTIATANATNWVSVHPVQIVNNTPVELEFRTEPDNNYFTLASGASIYASSVGDTSLYVGWGVDSSASDNIVLQQGFDDSDNLGYMSATSIDIGGQMNVGQAWALWNVGYNDTLVFTGFNIGNDLQLVATRIRGVAVYRIVTGINDNEKTDIFCLDTGVEFDLGSGAWGRCPAGETQVLIGDDFELLQADSSRDWSAAWLISNIHTTCTYAGNCSVNGSYNVAGEYINEFDSVHYSSSNSHIELELQGK